jgi:thiol-disulfide isomerase/thioredoxin
MKSLFTNIVLFIVLAVTLSSLAGCPATDTSKNSANETKSGTNETKKQDDNAYPPAPAAIAQAEIKLLDGKTFKLEEQKGKVILFNLWGIWCGPCIAEMPNLVEMQTKYKDKNFEIVGLNVGDDNGNPETEEAVKAFVEKKQLNYTIGYADRPLFEEFARVGQMAGVPISVLINRNGKMVGIFQGGGVKVLNTMKDTIEKTVSE